MKKETQIHSLLKKNSVKFGTYMVLRSLVLASLILAVKGGRYWNAVLCGFVLFVLLLPGIIERKLHIELPTVLECILFIFVYCAEILGEIASFYVTFPFWDTMLHTLNGFICAAVGFALVDILNRNKKSKFFLSPFYLAVVAFCFSMTVGVLWEFFEFGADMVFHTDMQKDFFINRFSSVALDATDSNIPISVNGIVQTTIETAAGETVVFDGYLDIGIIDTMKDLLVNFLGAVIFSVIGYFYAKNSGKSRFASNFIPAVKNDGEGTA